MAGRYSGRIWAEALRALRGDNVMPYSLIPSLGPAWDEGFFADVTVTNEAAVPLTVVTFTVQVRGIVDAVWGATFWEPVEGGARVTISGRSLGLGEATILRIKVRGEAGAGIGLQAFADEVLAGAPPPPQPAGPRATRDSVPAVSVAASGMEASQAYLTTGIVATALTALADDSLPEVVGEAPSHAIGMTRAGRPVLGPDAAQAAEWLVLGDQGLELSDRAVQALSSIGELLAASGIGGDGGLELASQAVSGADDGAASPQSRGIDRSASNLPDGRRKDGTDAEPSGVNFSASANVERVKLVGGRAVDGKGSIANDLSRGTPPAPGLSDDALDGDAEDSGAGWLHDGWSDEEPGGGQGDDPRPGDPGRDPTALRVVDADEPVGSGMTLMRSDLGKGRLVIEGNLLPGDVTSDARFDLGPAWFARGGTLS